MTSLPVFSQTFGYPSLGGMIQKRLPKNKPRVISRVLKLGAVFSRVKSDQVRNAFSVKSKAGYIIKKPEANAK